MSSFDFPFSSSSPSPSSFSFSPSSYSSYAISIDYSWLPFQAKLLRHLSSSLSSSFTHSVSVTSHDGRALTFDQTFFCPESSFLLHPQVSDHGLIQCSDFQNEIHHVFAASPSPFHILKDPDMDHRLQGKCTLSLDVTRRLLLSRTHSAMDVLGLWYEKLFHVPPVDHRSLGRRASLGSFRLSIPRPLSKQELAELLEKTNEWIAADHSILVELVSLEELAELEFQNKSLLFSYLPLPSHVPLVHFEDLGTVACDGTHLSSSASIGKIHLNFSSRLLNHLWVLKAWIRPST